MCSWSGHGYELQPLRLFLGVYSRALPLFTCRGYDCPLAILSCLQIGWAMSTKVMFDSNSEEVVPKRLGTVQAGKLRAMSRQPIDRHSYRLARRHCDQFTVPVQL